MINYLSTIVQFLKDLEENMSFLPVLRNVDPYCTRVRLVLYDNRVADS